MLCVNGKMVDAGNSLARSLVSKVELRASDLRTSMTSARTPLAVAGVGAYRQRSTTVAMRPMACRACSSMLKSSLSRLATALGDSLARRPIPKSSRSAQTSCQAAFASRSRRRPSASAGAWCRCWPCRDQGRDEQEHEQRERDLADGHGELSFGMPPCSTARAGRSLVAQMMPDDAVDASALLLALRLMVAQAAPAARAGLARSAGESVRRLHRRALAMRAAWSRLEPQPAEPGEVEFRPRVGVGGRDLPGAALSCSVPEV